MSHEPGADYTGSNLDRIAYPLGGIGTGGMCLNGVGELEAVALRHHPAVFHNPLMFASVAVAGHGARVLEGPVPQWRPSFAWGERWRDSGGGGRGTSYGFPRFDTAQFTDRFPAAEVALSDPSLPLAVTLQAWSPFIPGDADASSRPVIALEYTFCNTGAQPLDLVFGFHSEHHIAVVDGGRGRRIETRPDGFVLIQDPVDSPSEQGALRVACDAEDVQVDAAWFRGAWFDAVTRLWQGIAKGQHVQACHDDDQRCGDGASVTAAVHLAPGARSTLCVRLSWYMPHSALSVQREACEGACGCAPVPTYVPRYAVLHRDVDAVDAWLATGFAELRQRSLTFGELLASGDLPPVLREALTANLGILRSTTVLRQHDGRLWMWEGCHDTEGCCAGSCTHVWNWAQATAHLFPDLERGLRETEHGPAQRPDGGQRFRVPLPIDQVSERWWTAVDGQLGGLIKAWREWRIGGDTDWLGALWPALRSSLEYIIATFDPDRRGVLRGAQHNTYDIEFHGPNAMLMSCYLAALVAAADMAAALAVEVDYTAVAARCRAYLHDELWDGHAFIQRVELDSSLGEHRGSYAVDGPMPEIQALLAAEGPRYQYGSGLLVTALLGEWMACAGGLETGLDSRLIEQFLLNLYRSNFRRDLSTHANPQRPAYAFGQDSGLVLCTWRETPPSLPFPYCAEIWTSLEYQTAGHLLRHGAAAEAVDLVSAARSRHDGRVRNPFDEMECGHWYGRALASYDLLAAWGGARYDAVTQTMHLRPTVAGDYQVPFVAGSVWGRVGVRDGQAWYEPVQGKLVIKAWAYTPR
ncbi:MAG: GH116 family glycosyl hydrolase [Planctomycetota bacterium]|jgi:uncharacterized protein (DUF608 family)|nr:GH116 family glycosyl hydrolase [Planctomycetota bacterium]